MSAQSQQANLSLVLSDLRRHQAKIQASLDAHATKLQQMFSEFSMNFSKSNKTTDDFACLSNMEECYKGACSIKVLQQYFGGIVGKLEAILNQAKPAT